MKVVRILIVDDHFFVRAGLRSSLDGEQDLEICGEASGGATALESVTSDRPDLVLLDLRLADTDGLDVLLQLTERYPEIAVIIFSVEENESDISQAVENGAKGYLPKSVPRGELLTAIRKVAAGGTYFPESVASRLKESQVRTPLSPREMQVLRLIVDGHSNKLIAAELGISENTVKLHVTNLLAKTGAPDRTSVVKLAFQRGWVRA